MEPTTSSKDLRHGGFRRSGLVARRAGAFLVWVALVAYSAFCWWMFIRLVWGMVR